MTTERSQAQRRREEREEATNLSKSTEKSHRNWFYCEDDPTLDQAAQRGCEIPLLGNIKNLTGQSQSYLSFLLEASFLGEHAKKSVFLKFCPNIVHVKIRPEILVLINLEIMAKISIYLKKKKKDIFAYLFV